MQTYKSSYSGNMKIMLYSLYTLEGKEALAHDLPSQSSLVYLASFMASAKAAVALLISLKCSYLCELYSEKL